MSQIPSDLAISAAQAPFQARESAREQDGQRAAETSAASQQVKTVTEAGSTVETTDADVAVFADAEGSGSQGRASQDQPPPPEPQADGPPPGITRDAAGHWHVDLEA
jgi:hypothetical protein